MSNVLKFPVFKPETRRDFFHVAQIECPSCLTICRLAILATEKKPISCPCCGDFVLGYPVESLPSDFEWANKQEREGGDPHASEVGGASREDVLPLQGGQDHQGAAGPLEQGAQGEEPPAARPEEKVVNFNPDVPPSG